MHAISASTFSSGNRLSHTGILTFLEPRGDSDPSTVVRWEETDCSTYCRYTTATSPIPSSKQTIIASVSVSVSKQAKGKSSADSDSL